MEFIKYNANPKHRKTGDCFVRAICLALDKDWIEVYRELASIGIKSYRMICDKKVTEEYLRNRGIIKQRLPRKENNKRYTVEEFIDKFTENNKTYLIGLTRHLTVVINGVLVDTWNCKDKCVIIYYELDTVKPLTDGVFEDKQRLKRH